MRPSKRPEPTSAPSSKTSIIEADCTPRSATNPQPSSKPNSAKPKPSERTQPKLCPSNPVSQPRGAVHYGRVEEGRGGLRLGQSLRFPSPLIKPDVRISRIRLSDWLHGEAFGAGLGWCFQSETTPSSP